MAEYPFKHSIVNTDDNKQALLTANHVMTESGIWIPQRGSDDGATHTQVTGSNVEFDEFFLGETIPAGAHIVRNKVELKGNRIGIAIRLNVSTVDDFSVSIDNVADSFTFVEGVSDRMEAVDVITHDHYRYSASFYPNTPFVRIRIDNQSK